MDIRDRIIEFRRIDAVELMDNESNWKIHPKAQRGALRGILEEVGIAGALLAYHSERNGGTLTLINGHLRKSEHPGQWPVLITDLNDAEADLLLAFLDPIVGMAEAASGALKELAERLNPADPALRDLLDQQTAEAELAALMEQVAGDLVAVQGSGDDGRREGFSTRAKIRPTIWIDDLAVFESAIQTVGNPNRGESIIAICQFFLDHHSNGDTER